jgi:hypothetical protein
MNVSFSAEQYLAVFEYFYLLTYTFHIVLNPLGMGPGAPVFGGIRFTDGGLAGVLSFLWV